MGKPGSLMFVTFPLFGPPLFLAPLGLGPELSSIPLTKLGPDALVRPSGTPGSMKRTVGSRDRLRVGPGVYTVLQTS